MCLVLPSIHDFIPLIAAGALPFSVARPDESVRTGKKVPMPRRYDETMSTFKKQRITATAAPAAMKGSARARTVIAAPVNAEDRLLKVCVSMADKNNWINRHVRHWTGW